MIVQDFFKDVNAQCNVLNIRQPVLQVIKVLSFEKWHQGSENRSKVSVKNCRKIIKGTCDESLKVFAVGRIIHTLNSM